MRAANPHHTAKRYGQPVATGPHVQPGFFAIGLSKPPYSNRPPISKLGGRRAVLPWCARCSVQTKARTLRWHSPHLAASRSCVRTEDLAARQPLYRETMSWLYDYRIFSYVVAMGCEVAVFVQCTETLKLADHVAGGSFTYARLGVSAAALTILPLVYILFCECINRPAPIRMELASLPACAVLWLAVGALSVTSKRHNFGDGPCDSPSHTLSDICSYADPIMTFSFVPAGVMMLYELVLLLVAGCSARKGKPVWVHAVRGPELKEAML